MPNLRKNVTVTGHKCKHFVGKNSQNEKYHSLYMSLVFRHNCCTDKFLETIFNNQSNFMVQKETFVFDKGSETAVNCTVQYVEYQIWADY